MPLAKNSRSRESSRPTKMRANLELTSSLGRIAWKGQEHDVFATAHAAYDQAAGELVVSLDSYLRSEDLAHLEQKVMPPWLPAKQEDREHVDAGEAGDLAKDVFHRWCDKVRQRIPAR